VGFRSIALDGQHTEHSIARKDGDHETGLWRDELTRFGPVEKADGRPLGGPSTDDLWRSRPDDLAGETLAQRERTAFVLVSSVHLADDLDGLARLVVEGEEEDGGVHHPRGLVVESPEQLREVPRVRAQRAEATCRLEARPEVRRDL